MSDATQGPGWWLASDGRWYPPEQGRAQPSGPVPTAFLKQPLNKRARNAFVLGIVSLLCLGIVFGPVAVFESMKAKEECRRRLEEGDGLATAGIVLGIIGFVLNVLWLTYYLLADPSDLPGFTGP